MTTSRAGTTAAASTAAPVSTPGSNPSTTVGEGGRNFSPGLGALALLAWDWFVRLGHGPQGVKVFSAVFTLVLVYRHNVILLSWDWLVNDNDLGLDIQQEDVHSFIKNFSYELIDVPSVKSTLKTCYDGSSILRGEIKVLPYVENLKL